VAWHYIPLVYHGFPKRTRTTTMTGTRSPTYHRTSNLNRLPLERSRGAYSVNPTRESTHYPSVPASDIFIEGHRHLLASRLQAAEEYTHGGIPTYIGTYTPLARESQTQRLMNFTVKQGLKDCSKISAAYSNIE